VTTFGSRTHNPLTFPTKFGTYAHPMPSIVSTKNSSGAFFFPLESERKAPLRRLCAGPAQASQSTFWLLGSTILRLFPPNFGVRMRLYPLAFDKKWSIQLHLLAELFSKLCQIFMNSRYSQSSAAPFLSS
jgi:hypothetical protein